uniref:Uncharacterized protein n=1 Tax=uncultured marine virus TaxID=186617 RepID=A0A0F7L8U2_9VIRU|nr:hypothetical protein [uncultured marine virus]
MNRQPEDLPLDPGHAARPDQPAAIPGGSGGDRDERRIRNSFAGFVDDLDSVDVSGVNNRV